MDEFFYITFFVLLTPGGSFFFTVSISCVEKDFFKSFSIRFTSHSLEYHSVPFTSKSQELLHLFND